jgi:rhodanese-related sulfurtransferase
MAVGAFLGGEKLERIFSKRAGERPPESPSAVKARVFGGFAVAASLALAALLLPSRRAPEVSREVATLSATDLARRLVESPESLWLVDLRPSAEIAKGAIPSAMSRPAGDESAAFASALAPTRDLVVYGSVDAVPLPEGIARWGGRVLVLRGGFRSWQADVLTPPAAPAAATPELLAELRLKGALHSRFTGAAAATPVLTTVKPKAAAAPAPKKGGGC